MASHEPKQDPFTEERLAWRAVAGRPPGSQDHDPEAWDAWLTAAEQAGPDSVTGADFSDGEHD
jgi:hypothetical protein